MPSEPDYEIITTEQEFNALLVDLSNCPRNDPMNPLILDVETFPAGPELQANDRFTALLAGVAICHSNERAAYIPLQHTDGNNLRFDSIVDSSEQEALRRLSPFFNQWQLQTRYFFQFVVEFGEVVRH